MKKEGYSILNNMEDIARDITRDITRGFEEVSRGIDENSKRIAKHNPLKQEQKSEEVKEIKKEQKEEKKAPDSIKSKKIISKDETFKEIQKFIEKKFPESLLQYEDEDYLQNLLYVFLKQHYKDVKKAGKGDEQPDLVVNKKYAFEVKLGKNKAVLENVIGQLMKYKDHYKNLAIIVTDEGLIPLESMKWFEKTCPADIIILRGNWKKSKSKKNAININITR